MHEVRDIRLGDHLCLAFAHEDEQRAVVTGPPSHARGSTGGTGNVLGSGTGGLGQDGTGGR